MPDRLIDGHACLLVMLLSLAPLSAPSQVIDFETLPGGTPTVDQQEISNQYAPYGVTFTLLDRGTGLPIGFPRIAKAGAPQTAFEGCFAPDTPLPNLGLGISLLTDGVSLGVDGDVRIDYATPVAQASAVILDIDCRTNGGPPCEQWTITAYDGSGTPLQSVVLDAPQGGPNPPCDNPDAGLGDSQAFGWTIDAGTPQIASIILRYTGVATNVGLAFDNFSVASLPGPPNVMVVSEADTVCFGESVELVAEISGGLPPYAYQWQQETSPGSWVDLGTASTQEVLPTASSSYRVVVTDSATNETTSAPFTVTVTSGPLCDASLLVSCYDNDSVVRYGFQSRLASVFVGSGSGGLNGTSKLICGDDGHLYVSSQANDRVLRYDGATGAFMDTFVAAGSGGLNVPVGLDFGPDGNLYVASSVNHAVLRYDGVTGAFIDTFVPNGSGLNSPTGLVFGPDDNLYVCSLNGDKVLRFDGATGAPLGDFVTAGSGGLDSPRGLTFGPDGNLYIAEQVNDSVRRYDGTTGAFIDVFIPSGSGGLDRANDVVFGPDGILYVASYDNEQVLRYDASTGTPLGGIPDELLVGPAWFAVGCVPLATDAPVVVGRHPLGMVVEPNVPNPFHPGTTVVGFTLPAHGTARVTVHDVRGSLVATLLEGVLPAGRHTAQWNGRTSDGRPAQSGVYFLRVESGRSQECVKMVLVR